MAQVTPMVIDGKTVQGTSGKTIDVINPATEEVVGRVAAATSAEVDAAARSAHKALASGGRLRPLTARRR